MAGIAVTVTIITVITTTGIRIAETNFDVNWRAISGALIGLAYFSGLAVALSPAAPLSIFPIEIQAQQHCPSETIVWLNLPSGVYHYKGERWYGRTKNGAFVCRAEADRVGERASRSGQ